MSADDDGGVDFFTNTAIVEYNGRGPAAAVNATSSPAAENHRALPVGGASTIVSSYGDMDLLGDFSQPVASSHKFAPVGNSVDLLGDEIMPPPPKIVSLAVELVPGHEVQAASSDEGPCTAVAATEFPPASVTPTASNDDGLSTAAAAAKSPAASATPAAGTVGAACTAIAAAEPPPPSAAPAVSADDGACTAITAAEPPPASAAPAVSADDGACTAIAAAEPPPPSAAPAVAPSPKARDGACTEVAAAAESPSVSTVLEAVDDTPDEMGAVACETDEGVRSLAAEAGPDDNQGGGHDEAFSVPTDSDGDSEATAPDHDNNGDSQSLPSEREQGGDDDLTGDGSDAPGSQGSDGIIDSDREVVEEEDAFGDFADFTTASHFLPGGSLGAAAGQPPPPSASAAAAARAAGASTSTSSSPSAHRHAHLGASLRPTYGMLSGGGPQLHAASVSGAVSEHGSFGGDFSDFSHPSPPPSVAPSRAGGGRKSVASIASAGSRAGGDDDVGDYGSVVGSSVWRAPSQMATSSYAAAAGADDDFGDFTSDITSTSDFAPSTQPPSAVAVSGPGSVHPDDDFGSFASHRSTADDDEDDFGNFNAAPAGSGAAAGQGPSSSGASGSGAGAAGGCATAGMAGTSSAGGASSGFAGGSTLHGAGGASLSPREGPAGVSGPRPYHSTQTVGPATGASGGTVEAPAETGLLQLPSPEVRQAVARALQPLAPARSSRAVAAQHSAVPEEQVSAAWAQLRRHAGARADGGIAAHNGMPMPTLAGAADAGGQQDGAAGRGGCAPAVKFNRPLRWKGSDSERRLLSGLGLSELAAQARMLDAAEGPRSTGRGRSDTGGSGGGVRQLGMLASFGDAPRKTRGDVSTMPGGLNRDTECDKVTGSGNIGAGSGGGDGSRTRGLDQNGEGAWSAGSLLDLSAGAGAGATPRQASSTNGHAGQQQQGVGMEAANGSAQAS